MEDGKRRLRMEKEARHSFSTEDSESEVSLDLDDELYENVPFQFGEALSPDTKESLSLPTTRRDNYSSLNVIVELDKLDFFQKFDYATKQELRKKMTYETFQDKEYLLQQDEYATGIFVLLSGVVSLRYSFLVLTDENGGAEEQWPERVLRRGAYFGHSDLLRHRPSSVDAYAVGYCEVLKLDADHFGIVRNVLKPKQVQLKMAISSSKVLKKFKWSSEELKALEMFSKLDSHLEEVEIYSGSDGTRPKWSQFLVEGECLLCREVPFYAVDLGTSEIQIRAAQDDEMNRKILKKEFQFSKVRQGYYFGVGEDFGANRVHAKPAVECLSVMRQVLMFKNKKLLQEMADSLVRSLPTDQDLLDSFWNKESAMREVKEMMEGIVKSNQDGEQTNKKLAKIKYFV